MVLVSVVLPAAYRQACGSGW